MNIFTSIVEKSLTRGEARAKAFCKSKQLRGGMYTELERITKRSAHGRIRVPHYWAYYYHEGRKVIRKQDGGALVWFRNPKDDPRLTNGLSPIYKNQVKRLTRAQYLYWRDENKKARAAGRQPPMIVSKRSPRSGMPKFTGNPFFSNDPGGGMAGFGKEVVDVAKQEAFSRVEGILRAKELKKKKITKVI